MDSFRNFMENNQYLKGGSAQLVTALPNIGQLSNLENNASALVGKINDEMNARKDGDKTLEEADRKQDADLKEEIKKIKTELTRANVRINSMESKIALLEETIKKQNSAILQITQLLKQLA